MKLEGRLEDLGLAELLRLLGRGGRTGALKVSADEHAATVYLRGGSVYYGASSSPGAPLGRRLVKARRLTDTALTEALGEQEESKDHVLLASVLKAKGLVPGDVLAAYVRDQILDAVSNVFTWDGARYEFVPDEAPSAADIDVSVDVEDVIAEGRRRAEQWDVIMGQIGSLEKVPHLAGSVSGGQVVLEKAQWDVLCFVDGRRDINTIVAESGFDRFHTVSTLHGLFAAGLLVVQDPTLELLGQKLSLGVVGPIDTYNLTFLTMACTSEISGHMRLEELDGEEVEVRISAGVREVEGERSALLYSCESRTPPAVVRRMALETTGYVVLVNMNSTDSVASARRDVEFMTEIGDRPYVVGAYSSILGEDITVETVRELLRVADSVPVMEMSLRDPEDTGRLVRAALELVP